MSWDIHPVITEEQYHSALSKIEKLMEADVEPGSKAGQTLQTLVTLVEKYEEENIDIDEADPVTVIEHQMSRLGLNQAELARQTGIKPPRISDILNRKRELTKSQIETLSRFFGISTDLLHKTEKSSQAA